MHPQLKVMLEIQDLEKELIILKSQAEAISIPLERTRARRQAARRDLLAVKDKLERTVQQRRQQEKDLAEMDSKLKQAYERQVSVRNPKEAQALDAEIERIMAAQNAAEDDGLAVMDAEEQLTKQLADRTASTRRDVEQMDTEIKRLEGLLAENQSLATGLREERVAGLNRMDAQTRESYEWLVNRYGSGQAVADVKGAACHGCGSMLLPDQRMKVNDLEALHRCSSCSRYLLGSEL